MENIYLSIVNKYVNFYNPEISQEIVNNKNMMLE
jgi:hypothetical protein